MTVDHVSAIHEAAHCVVASCAGYALREVVLHPAGGRVGEGGRCVLWDQQAEFAADPSGFLVYALSGAAAEQHWFGRMSTRSARDLEIAVAAAVLIHDGADASSAKVQGTLRAAGALATVRMHNATMRAAIETVARAFTRRPRLSGNDVVDILRGAR